MKELKDLKIGCAPFVYGQNTISIRRATNGCHGCAFEKSEGARYCEMKECCMAHHRPDRTSVIFVMK